MEISKSWECVMGATMAKYLLVSSIYEEVGRVATEYLFFRRFFVFWCSNAFTGSTSGATTRQNFGDALKTFSCPVSQHQHPHHQSTAAADIDIYLSFNFVCNINPGVLKLSCFQILYLVWMLSEFFYCLTKVCRLNIGWYTSACIICIQYVFIQKKFKLWQMPCLGLEEVCHY